MHPIKIQSFEGPLDLLLQLIEAQKLPITEVALADVTEQYSREIARGTIPTEEVADFLVIAAKLLLLKSRTLLPELAPEAEEGASLVEQLKVYKLYRDKLPIIEELWNAGAVAIARPKMPASWHALFRPPETLEPRQLRDGMIAVINKIVPAQKVLKYLVERAVTVQEKIVHILDRLKSGLSAHFSTLLKAGNRSEAIVSFLALLELTKQRVVAAQQKGLFEEIEVRKVERGL